MTPPGIKTLIQLSLEEDMGRGDLTAVGLSATKTARANLVAKEACVASCLWLAQEVLREASAEATVQLFAKDGAAVSKGSTVLCMEGTARDLLGIERTLLNFLQRSFGIASLAARYKEAIGDLPVRVTDTRKTLPGFRALDKRAVKDGGLFNHRFGLDGGILIKENHIRAGGGIAAVVEQLKRESPHGLKIEVEVTTREEAFQALKAGAEALLLDNFSPSELTAIVAELKATSGVLLEASGGITLHNIKEFAATGVDIISIGALTHSVPAADLSLQFEFFP